MFRWFKDGRVKRERASGERTRQEYLSNWRETASKAVFHLIGADHVPSPAHSFECRRAKGGINFLP